jgi:quercetin dioxygenase-like cupin family protein
MSDEGVVVGPDGIAGLESPSGEGPMVVRASGNETGGAYDIVEATIKPGPGVTPLHVHHDNDEAILVLDGELIVQFDDEKLTLPAGGYAMASSGVPHTYQNSGSDPARILFIYSPGNHWEYLEGAAAEGPVEEDADIERMRPILESYGIEMVGPPLDESAGTVS